MKGYDNEEMTPQEFEALQNAEFEARITSNKYKAAEAINTLFYSDFFLENVSEILSFGDTGIYIDDELEECSSIYDIEKIEEHLNRFEVDYTLSFPYKNEKGLEDEWKIVIN